MHKRAIYLVVALQMFTLITSGCSECPLGPSADIQYSEYLTVQADGYEKISGVKVAESVDAIQIFLGEGGDISDLRRVRRSDLLFESRQPSAIARVLGSLQDLEADTDEPCDISGPSVVLVAYDSTLFRIGVVRLYVCGKEQGAVIGVRPIGDAAIMYSREAVGVLGALGVLKSSRTSTGTP